MPKVDFRILPDDHLTNLHQFACRLAEQNWKSGKRTLLQTDSADQSQQLDDLLWNLRADSFIPHAIATLENTDQQQPILISHQKINDTDIDNIINVSSRPCDLNLKESDHLDELLNQDEQRKQSSRENYKVYRQLGYELEHHNLETGNDK